jgi:hypothetical protein
MRIVNEVSEYDDYFMCKKDDTGLVGLSSVQKCMITLRCLIYEVPPKYKIWQSRHIWVHESVYRFCRTMVAVFGPIYLRVANEGDILESWHKTKQENFLWCLGASIACWDGSIVHSLGNDYTKVYKGRTRECCVLLECVTVPQMVSTCCINCWAFAKLAGVHAPEVNYEIK